MERKEWVHSEVSGAGTRGHSLRIRLPDMEWFQSQDHRILFFLLLALLLLLILKCWHSQYLPCFLCDTYKTQTVIFTNKQTETKTRKRNTKNNILWGVELETLMFTALIFLYFDGIQAFIQVRGCGCELFSLWARYKNPTFAYHLLHVLTGDSFYNLSVPLFETWDNKTFFIRLWWRLNKIDHVNWP